MHNGRPHNHRISGTWSLKQVNTEAAFSAAVETEINTTLDFANIRGFCLRTLWSTLEPTKDAYDDTILNHALALTNAKGKRLAVRLIAGQYTPSYVFDSDGARWFFDADPQKTATADAATDVFTSTAHGFSVGTQIRIDADTYPGGTDSKTTYFCRTVAADTFKVATTNSDATIVDLTTAGAGIRVGLATTIRGPDACVAAGTANTLWIDRWKAMMTHLAAWCRTNNVPFLHGSWTSLDYSELYHGKPLRSAGGSQLGHGRAGYDAATTNFTDALKLLVDHAYSLAGSDLAVELAMSGLHVEDVQPALISYMDTVGGAWSGRLYTQSNGFDDTGDWGGATEDQQDQQIGYSPYPPVGVATGANTTTAKVSRGHQMINPGNYTRAQWETMLGGLFLNRADYWEVYTGASFTGANGADLQRCISEYARRLAGRRVLRAGR